MARSCVSWPEWSAFAFWFRTKKWNRARATLLAKVGASLEAVDFYRVKTDRVWTRDFAPSFIVARDTGREVAAVKWRFNAWAKYDNWQLDEAAGAKIPNWPVRARGRRRWYSKAEASTLTGRAG